MPRKHARTLSIGRTTAVAGVLSALAIVVAIVTVLILSALGDVAKNANALDDQRSLETTSGALSTYLNQLTATLNDYAAWDDAARFTYAADGLEWIISNYGDMTVNSELFDTAVLIDMNDQILMSYRQGVATDWSLQGYFGDGLAGLIQQARSIPTGQPSEVSGFLRTQDGIAAVGVALVRNKSGLLDVPEAARRYLIFARHLTAQKIEQLAHTYVINGLALQPPDTHPDYFVSIVDPRGQVLGNLTWQSQMPGDISMREVRPRIFAANAISLLFFLALIAIGTAALRKLKSDEASARRELLSDRLTGLYNRPGLFQGLKKCLLRSGEDNSYVNLIYLDLDGFKEINDSFGHGAGDLLIKGVAAALKVLVADGTLLARLGGDEFAIVLQGPDARIESRKLCDDILTLFSEPFMIGDRVAAIGCSIGTAVSKGGDIDGEELLRRADMAMYEAKESGRGRYMAYEPHMDTRREEKNQLEADLKYAIEHDEIKVVFQPVVNTLTRRINGVEALARWNRAGYGPVSPDVFIAAAESSGLIDQLGLAVLRKACHEAVAWPDIKLAVNISPVQFRNPLFAAQVLSILEEHDIAPARVMLEMTEGYFIHHPERAGAAIEKLKQIGVSIALDDFGSGFASIGYLRRFGFNRMKIDKSLVVALDEGGRSLEMLTATVALARSLGIPVTAEGIETEDQAAILHLCGCDELQGYLFSRPIPAEQILPLLEAQDAPVAQRKVS
ncbi:putative bifunctional diguanylate cyclase/phosphodiesterase [Agrobacterium rosae]|uniref:Bifunctional diguanylate cyclase/phosphodiesterase n=1 Tax=Agrobacterium rosae TaxID=1972867 RepID=A0AAE5S0L5_9HYPH|nr:bifunctional diguanylate cyclase/phosphodiesterase [Agrobacterium rosae]KAA3512985.1 bifunctional diguanylate cyclase/phosphodiesterase [Agrobacterium rosae]KAA3521529.1 bifunctional diguanylate cyclase/phosphodiesterase [Agrobacterium rosae]MCM2432598.1 bifunctional diguanylate cyclase/phosphodiesterase [Agrobacterium rosae]MDX8328331.1 bifunctional diguanylate cyclase/phosphodiesterase [Agrobacterium rosae]MQB48448.1 bifunctional diguanylate cyclase/phosphodiesterase [Agrobacterium rosae]